jgi:uncharacterized protein YqgV (UPF0045/DUF77 family)
MLEESKKRYELSSMGTNIEETSKTLFKIAHDASGAFMRGANERNHDED